MVFICRKISKIALTLNFLLSFILIVVHLLVLLRVVAWCIH